MALTILQNLHHVLGLYRVKQQINKAEVNEIAEVK